MNRPGTRTILGLLAALSLTTSLAGAEQYGNGSCRCLVVGSAAGAAVVLERRLLDVAASTPRRWRRLQWSCCSATPFPTNATPTEFL